MSEFKFKQFSISDTQSAMKVGTDGVLIGAWASHQNPKRILDIGCGSGLIALMMAQRYPNAKIDAVEIDSNAAKQALANVDNSSWASRITIHHQNILDFENGKYDLIVSNPPFFESPQTDSSNARQKARSQVSLDLNQLFNYAAEHLSSQGKLAVILPKAATISENLATSRICRVFPTETKPQHRVLIELQASNEEEVNLSRSIIELERHVYTEDYINLTKDFYLNM